jgi:hypothetical protein
MTIKKTTRTRLHGYVGIAIATLLTPAGKIISTAVAAATVVGVLSTSDQPPASKKIRSAPAANVMTTPIALPSIINADLPSVAATASASADAALAKTQPHPQTSRSNTPNQTSHTSNPRGFGQPANHGLMGSAPSKAKPKPSPDSKPAGKNPGRVFPVMPPITKTTAFDPDCKAINRAKRSSEEAPADQPATMGPPECKSDKDKLAESDTPDGHSTEPHVPDVVARSADPEVIQDAMTPLKGSDDSLTPDNIASGNNPGTFVPVLHDPDMQNPDGALATSVPPASPAVHEPGMPPSVDLLPAFALPIILASTIPIGLAGDGAGQNLSVSGIAAAPIPEPATLSLVALGLLGLSWMNRKKWVSLASK